MNWTSFAQVAVPLALTVLMLWFGFTDKARARRSLEVDLRMLADVETRSDLAEREQVRRNLNESISENAAKLGKADSSNLDRAGSVTGILIVLGLAAFCLWSAREISDATYDWWAGPLVLSAFVLVVAVGVEVRKLFR
jgi:hypothetical protein